ncbi:MAG: hypothetical protein LBT27_01870, partial [Prevotellaceae bacterium]|nr:hypothetical protein [Prevotellaceae bacterium]
KGGSGRIEVNIFHTQDSYYPLWITAESYKLKGLRLEDKSYVDGEGTYCTGNYGWGYADNYGSDMIQSEGNKNFFKISNAVKTDGSNANLQSIDFIKVQNAVNIQGLNGIGESSTEVLNIKDENVR